VAFRDGPFENIKVPVVWTAAVAMVACALGAGLLLIGDAHGQSAAQPVRTGVEATTGPVGGVLAAPVRWFGSLGDGISGYFFAVSENRRLKAEHVELLRLRDQNTALRIENARYETLLAIRPDPPVPMVTGRAVSDARGPFSNARLIDVGTGKGVKIGHPVVNEQGLLGRVVGTSGGVSRLLLLTDVASRTPVMIQRTDARALLTGDGSGNPRLEFVRGVGAVQVGDRILSSGDGGAFPRGIPVGVVAKGLDGGWRVKLFSDRGPIDYVRVMLFEDFGQLVGPHDLDAPPLSGLTPVPMPASRTPTAPAPGATTPNPAPATPAPATGGPG
jgi:rod shape-determining protein MreC